MNKLRYPDREILCKYKLTEELFDVFGLEVVDLMPLRKVFILDTTNGKMIVKRIEDNKERIDFITSVLECVDNKYSNIMRYHKSINGNYIEEINGNKYVVLEMKDGREVTFTNNYEIELCVKEIGNIHNYSKGIGEKFNEFADSIEYIKKLEDEFIEFNYIKNLVEKFRYKNNFDNLFIDTVDYYKNQYNISIEMIKKIDWDSACFKGKNQVLCHNDLAHHNFILDGDIVTIIDYDYCSIGYKVCDLYNFQNKVMKSVNYDVNIFKFINSKYSECIGFSEVEYSLLRALMIYPRDYFSMVRGYYLKQKSWSEEVFFNRLSNKITSEGFRKEFLKLI